MLIVIGLTIFNSLFYNAQSLSKMGENYMKQYTASIEKLKAMDVSSPKFKNEVANAERIIKSIQKSDPGYDITSLNSEIATYKDNAGSQLSNNGKTYLKEIEKRFEVLRKLDPSVKTYQDEIVIAKRNVDYLSKSDPGYDLSKINNELDQFSGKLKSGLAKNEDKRKSQQGLDSQLQEFLDATISSSYSKQELKENLEQVEDFKIQFNDYIQNTLLKNSDSKYSLPKIEAVWKEGTIDRETIDVYKNEIKKNTNEIYAENSFCQMELIKAKWSLLSNAFKESEILKSAVNEISEVMKLEGGKEGILKIVKVNKIEAAKKMRMAPDVNSNAALKEQIKVALMECNHGKGRTVIKINILRADWAIQKNEITGKILGRALDYEAALKNADGSCVVLKSSWFHQDYNGSTYGKGYIEHGDLKDILCENVSK